MEEDRSRILEYVVEKYGRGVIQESLGVSRYTMWRPLNRKVACTSWFNHVSGVLGCYVI